jgi:hypothetical protein
METQWQLEKSTMEQTEANLRAQVMDIVLEFVFYCMSKTNSYPTSKNSYHTSKKSTMEQTEANLRARVMYILLENIFYHMSKIILTILVKRKVNHGAD